MSRLRSSSSVADLPCDHGQNHRGPDVQRCWVIKVKWSYGCSAALEIRALESRARGREPNPGAGSLDPGYGASSWDPMQKLQHPCTPTSYAYAVVLQWACRYPSALLQPLGADLSRSFSTLRWMHVPDIGPTMLTKRFPGSSLCDRIFVCRACICFFIL